MRITVGIPTYNRSNYLKETLESVLTQSWDDLEIIVSDNASEDNTKDVVDSIISMFPTRRIIYNRNDKNFGAYYNWKKCIEMATGDFFVMLSDDDLLLPDAIKNLYQGFFEQTVLCIGNLIFIDGAGNATGEHDNPSGRLETYAFWDARLQKGFHDTPSAVMYRTKLAKQYFPIIEECGSCVDLALDLLIAIKGEVNCIDTKVTQYRIHEKNDSKNFYRCASSHINIIDFMKNYGIENKMMLLLERYCYDIICYNALSSLYLNKNINEFQKCVYLLKNKKVTNSFSALLFLLKYIIRKGYKRLYHTDWSLNNRF